MSFNFAGPCASGIIGHNSFRYSVFGESVKIASRMSRNVEGGHKSINYFALTIKVNI